MNNKRSVWRLTIEAVLALAAMALVVVLVVSLAQGVPPASEAGAGDRQSQPTAGDPPWFATKMAIETALMQTRQAAPLTPYPWTLWTWTPDPRPATATSTPWIGDPFRLTPSGWIIWGGGETYGIICYKTSPEQNPYTILNYWRDIDSSVIVEAGAYGVEDPPGDGAVFFVGEDPCRPEVHLAPFSEGPLEIIDVVGNVLLLQARSTGRVISFDADRRQFEEPIPTATVLPSPTPEGGPQPPAYLADFVLFAEEKLQLGARVRMETGSLGVNDGPDGPKSGELSVGSNSSLGPNTTFSADSIALSPGARMSGLAFCNDIDVRPGAFLAYPCESPLALPLLSLPDLPSFAVSPSAPTLVVPGGEERALIEEEYGKVTVKPDGVLTFLTGLTVEIRELILEPGARLECQHTCDLRIVQLLRIGPNAYFGTSPWIGPEEFTVSIRRSGGTGFEAQQGSDVAAVVIAPETAISLGSNGRYMGTFVGKTITVGTGAWLYQTAPLGLPPE